MNKIIKTFATVCILTVGIGFLLMQKSQLIIPYRLKVSTEEEFNVADDSCENLPLMIAQIKACLLDHMSKSSTKYPWIFNGINVCCSFLTKALHVSSVYGEEPKYYLLPANRNTTRECTVVSLGIGNQIGAEEKLRNIWPLCKFFGADPFRSAGKIYEKVGSYYEVAVSGQNGNYTSSVKVGHKKYRNIIVHHISLEKFLRLINTTFIDHLWLDAEGAEYEILPIIESANRKFRSEISLNLTICQLNVELHLPLHMYGVNIEKFNEILRNFILNTPFVPLLASPIGGHIRLFWLNFGEQKCVQKYLPNFDKIYRNYLYETYGIL